MDKVSVIVPVYNVGEYVDTCIESLAGQTYENLEIIVINDGSTDNSLSVCRKWEEKDSRIIVIDQKNQGVSVARNAGIAKSTGNWICFVDGDDWMDTDAIERMLKSVRDDTDILITDYYVNSADRQWTESFFHLKDHDFGREEHIELIKNCYLRTAMAAGASMTMVGVPWAKLFRADLIRRYKITYDADLRKMQDALFCSEAFYHGGKIIYRSFSTYHYRQNFGSVTHKGNAAYQKIADAVIRAFRDFIRKYHLEEELTPVYYARKFMFACESVKFIYILDETGMRLREKTEAIHKLMDAQKIHRCRKQMWPYLSKPYRLTYLLHRMHAYTLMYLMMYVFYRMKMKRIG